MYKSIILCNITQCCTAEYTTPHRTAPHRTTPHTFIFMWWKTYTKSNAGCPSEHWQKQLDLCQNMLCSQFLNVTVWVWGGVGAVGLVYYDLCLVLTLFKCPHFCLGIFLKNICIPKKKYSHHQIISNQTKVLSHKWCLWPTDQKLIGREIFVYSWHLKKCDLMAM